jgi:hypothetical protein
MSTTKRSKRGLAFGLALMLGATLAGCGDDKGKPAPMVDGGSGSPDGGGGPDGGTPATDGGSDTGPAQLVFKDWVHDLVTTWHKDTTDPDTVNDKEGRLVFTEDETAFDDVLK